jgi:hypothetical protein
MSRVASQLRVAAFLLLTAVIACTARKTPPPDPPPEPSPGTSAETSPAQTAGTPTAGSTVPWFREDASASGLVFQHISGHRDQHLIPEVIGGGVALFDMDGDDDLDAYCVQSGNLRRLDATEKRNQLFRNHGDGTFDEVSSGSGADVSGYGIGVASGDYDNDGDLDLFVTNVGPNVLLRNDGAGRFTDVTTPTGVGDDGFGTSAAFVDYDRDGDLDLFVLNYLRWSVATEQECRNDSDQPTYCSPASYDRPARDVLYRNEEQGTFTDVTAEVGIVTGSGPGLGVVCGDFTGDGTVDVFMANDGARDQLWVGHAGGRFIDEAMARGCALDQEGIAKAGMGVTAEDIDDDGDLDVLICNIERESDSLFVNEGEYFSDRTARSGLGAVSRTFTRFGMAWVDFDHDGFFDLYQANGKVSLQGAPTENPFAEANLLFRGNAAGRFEEVKPRGGTSPVLVATSRGAAFGDIDGDGDIDFLVSNRDGPVHLLRNVAPKAGGWLSLAVVNSRGAPAIGAVVRFRLGERRLTRYVRTAYSYCAANDPTLHVGTGAVDKITDVTVEWVDGVVERFPDQRGGQRVTLRRTELTPSAR